MTTMYSETDREFIENFMKMIRDTIDELDDMVYDQTDRTLVRTKLEEIIDYAHFHTESNPE